LLWKGKGQAFFFGEGYARAEKRCQSLWFLAMQVRVNGETQEVSEGATVEALVARFKLAPKRIAVEVNQELVPRETYGCTVLHEGDRVEIVTFVGGG